MLVNFKTPTSFSSQSSISYCTEGGGYTLQPISSLSSFSRFWKRTKGGIFLRGFRWLSLLSVTSPFWKSLYVSSSWKEELSYAMWQQVWPEYLPWASEDPVEVGASHPGHPSHPPNPSTTFKSHAWSNTPLCLLGSQEVPSYLPSVAQFWAPGHMWDPNFIPPRDQNSMQCQRPIIILLPEG